MNKRFQNDVRMAEAVHDVLEKYSEVWNKSKGFSKEVEESRNLMQQMEESRVQALNKSNGVTKAKANLRELAATMCFNLANRASVYAGKQRNIEMLAKLHVTRSKLEKMSDNKLLDKLKNVYDALLTLGDGLELYDIVKEYIEDFKELITKYKIIIPKPRVAQIAVKNYNCKSAEVMKLIKVSFDNMDKLLSNFNDKNFLSEFTSARIIIALGSRSEKKDDTENNSMETSTPLNEIEA